MKIDDCKIIKELGHGMYGTVYEVQCSKSKQKFALKVEHILPTNVKKNTTSVFWREIDFATTLGELYPDQFMKLYDYDIVQKCKHKQVYSQDPKLFSESAQKSFDNLSQSNYCSRKLYPFVDSTLYNEMKMNNLTLKEKYSMICQYTYIIYLMNKHGYVHNDLHNQNVGVRYTKKKFINIFGKKIPTFGRMLCLIDYGRVLHSQFKFVFNSLIGEQEEKLYEDAMEEEIKRFLYWFVIQNVYFYLPQMEPIKKSAKGNAAKLSSLLQYYMPDIMQTRAFEVFRKSEERQYMELFSPYIQTQFFLYQIMYPEKFQKSLLGKRFKKVIPDTIELPVLDIIFSRDYPTKTMEQKKIFVKYFTCFFDEKYDIKNK